MSSKSIEDYYNDFTAAGLAPDKALELANKYVAENEKAKQKRTRAKKKNPSGELDFDYQQTQVLPPKIRDLMAANLAMETEDAKKSGKLAFMTRSLAMATLPHKSLPDQIFVRKNGNFVLTLMTSQPGGLPSGSIPRLVLTWICTEAVKKRDRALYLGKNLSEFMQKLELDVTGGKNGTINRVRKGTKALLGTVINYRYEGKERFALNNVLLAEGAHWWETDSTSEDAEREEWEIEHGLQSPASILAKEKGWQSLLLLNTPFFNECIDNPFPIDQRAVNALRSSPLTMDIYVWLTYRMSYLSRSTKIPWQSLAGQFGSGYADTPQGLRDFKRSFNAALKKVLIIYPEANVEPTTYYLILKPSRTHVPPEAQIYMPPQKKFILPEKKIITQSDKQTGLFDGNTNTGD